MHGFILICSISAEIYFTMIPFSAAIAFNIASLLLACFLGFFRASRKTLPSVGNRFCLANASVCHARHSRFSNSSWSRRCFCCARRVNSYGVYSPTDKGSSPNCTTARSKSAARSKTAATLPPCRHPPPSSYRMPRSAHRLSFRLSC